MYVIKDMHLNKINPFLQFKNLNCLHLKKCFIFNFAFGIYKIDLHFSFVLFVLNYAKTKKVSGHDQCTCTSALN